VDPSLVRQLVDKLAEALDQQARGCRASYGVVTDHPFFTVTGADGTFKLDKLPPGHDLLDA